LGKGADRVKIKEKANRKGIQWAMMPLLPAVIAGGYFYPLIGLVVVALIFFFLVLARFRGRFYCGWFCPMGAFHERVLGKISLNRPIPGLFYKSGFRWTVFGLMMSLLAFRLLRTGGEPEALANAFRFMWIVSTSLAVAIGVVFKPRSWCRICPMASMQALVSQDKFLLTVSEDCKSCGLCEKACPIGSSPQKSRGGTMPGSECMRCYNCVESCPKKALSFMHADEYARAA
jgi:polyferredoxin